MKKLIPFFFLLLAVGCGSSHNNSGTPDSVNQGLNAPLFPCGSTSCPSATQFCRLEQQYDRATDKTQITSSNCKNLPPSCKDCDCLSQLELNTTNGNGMVACAQVNSELTVTRTW